MQNLPQRTSLVAQTADVLRDAIAKGQWSRWLPGELELTKRLRVSRVTLRAALAELERENLIRAGQGRRREVIGKPKTKARSPARRVVALLSPVPLHQLPTSTIFWMDELRGHLDAAGWLMETQETAAAYTRRPRKALDELFARVRPAGWVLFRSTPEMQHWFSENRSGAVIAGSRHEGVTLSSVDIDYGAASRHAAGRFRAAGHRDVAIVREATDLAGDLQSAAAFQAGMDTNVPAVLHDGTAAGVCRSLDRLFAKSPAPTGLFIFHASHLLSVQGWLQLRGMRVPRDVSLICRDSEPFLESVIPAPSRYAINAGQFAKRISRLVVDLLSGASTRVRQLRIIPNSVHGETLATLSR